MRFWSKPDAEDISDEELMETYHKNEKDIEANDGRLTSGSSAELDALLDNQEVLEFEIERRNLHN